ncbi:hypothetical protein [uncultured Algibacter sp.]|uniref:hypothetical protein n=1 Tax=uncultured Algibacter sp. TaxID=298659 RepID=UPI002627B017|nr:hypothetical protein [uncultured Algibacter sp.]
MAVNIKTLKVGDLVSEIENHTNLNERKDCIHEVTFIRPFPHGKYMEIGLSGYSDEDRKTETFSEFQVYELPLSLELAENKA